MKIDEFCSKLDGFLAARPEGERVGAMAKALAQAFHLQPGEVALLRINPTLESLAFVWPEALKKSGTIPLSARDSLAARTAREKKAFINNRFAAARHASIFEAIAVESGSGDRPLPIQKILSVPLVHGEDARGVVQLSRKGASPQEAGGDFSKNDLVALTRAAEVLAGYF